MQLQKLDPIFNMGVDVIRPAFNFELRYRVTMLTTEEWTKGPETSPAVKRLVWVQMGPGCGGELGLESMGNLWEEGSLSV